ncbi:MAG: hypothetical protein CLLPBCKN_003872 [Chroococcidiopsis cubana SAG 39.79]|uniref:hypothetical protein n=1 Tax=Chroococcidiopsis cubana TaxID=171392 RepID=UPI002AC7AAAF|nr:hypothetical protein [Chroococcidiopsis cubana]MDZ4874476.1 hypothetical protein [Chroococcidiopsis cubana SAG 39.79]
MGSGCEELHRWEKRSPNARGRNFDRAGRVIVEPDLSLANYSNIFIIGDLANYSHQDDKPYQESHP